MWAEERAHRAGMEMDTEVEVATTARVVGSDAVVELDRLELRGVRTAWPSYDRPSALEDTSGAAEGREPKEDPSGLEDAGLGLIDADTDAQACSEVLEDEHRMEEGEIDDVLSVRGVLSPSPLREAAREEWEDGEVL